MKRKIRWGVIGSGGIARRRTIPEGFVPARNAQLMAVWGGNTETNQEIAQQFEAQAAESLGALLASDIDAVYVASPVAAHLPQVKACAEAGKHVLCEKPLGLTVEEAEAMAATCKAAGVQLGTAFMMRYHSQHQAAVRLIQEGRIGKPVFARAQLSCWYPPMAKAWRQNPELGGGGSLIDMGSHCIDLLEMLFGPVLEVNCFINRTIHSYASEDSAVALLKFANGALGSVDTFFCIPDDSSRNVLELYGSKGSITASGTIGQGSQGAMLARLESTPREYEAQQSRTSGDPLRISPEPVNMYRAEIEAFSESILKGEPQEGAEIGVRNQKIIAACYESARTGRSVQIK